MINRIHTIAFYLPQFHPIKENNEWFGEGFTEWTNVGKSKPLFIGHYQPKVPADLGYYDLRLAEVREQQTKLAKEAGIDAFCYYHYWFGNGRQIMEKPFEDVVNSKSPDFPFCLCWANHSFYRKNWNSDTKALDTELLIEQEYPGDDDIENHFYSLLKAFKDSRYYCINGHPLFVVYDIKRLPNPHNFFNKWNELASKEGLESFYFLTYTINVEDVNSYPFNLGNGVILTLINNAFTSGLHTRNAKRIKYIRELIGEFLKLPLLVMPYKKAIKYMTHPIMAENNTIPCIAPNWDVSPRRGRGATILHKSTPALFYELVSNAISLIKRKPDKNRILFIKSWNEWGEGNYMEPDLRYGKGYIKALRKALDENELISD